MDTRKSKNEYYLDIAQAVASRSTCLRRKVGAIIVNNDVIVSTGYNGAPRGRVNCTALGECERERRGVAHGERYELCRSVHAEANAIINAGRERTKGATMYLAMRDAQTGEVINAAPCDMCRRLIINAGVERVIVKTRSGGSWLYTLAGLTYEGGSLYGDGGADER